MARPTDVVARIAVPFFGGFLGTIGVALVGYALSVAGVSGFFGAAPRSLTQGLESISWGGAMWGLIPAVFFDTEEGQHLRDIAADNNHRRDLWAVRLGT